jgi:hypothetical protein
MKMGMKCRYKCDINASLYLAGKEGYGNRNPLSEDSKKMAQSKECESKS